MFPRYNTPVFDSADPIVCHSISMRPSLWTVFWHIMEIWGTESQWRDGGAGHATVAEVITEIINATDLAIFTGCIMLGEVKWITTDVPDFTLLCDGATYDRVDYPDLYAVLNSNYIIDADTFKVPDLIERYALGDIAPGIQGGETVHTITVAELPSHRHAQDQFGAAASTVLGELPGFEIAPEAGFTDYEGGGDAMPIDPLHETLVPVIIALYPVAG